MYVGIDVGGTKTAVGISENPNEVQFTDREQVTNTNDFEKDYEQIRDLVAYLANTRSIDAIGLALPGILTPDKTTIQKCLNLPGWSGKPIKQRLETDFSVPVKTIHDVAAAALGEYLYGSANEQDYLFVIWGTGLSSALLRKQDQVVSITSDESGFHAIAANSPYPTWGSNCAGRGIAKKYGKGAGELNEDEWNEVADFFAIGLYNLITITGTDLIVVGGGVMDKQQQLLPRINEKVKAILEQNRLQEMLPEIRVANLGSDAGLYGAIGRTITEM